MPDSPSNDSHKDRMRRVVDTVDKLSLAHEAEWQKQVSEFLLEVAAHRKAENEAKEVCWRAALDLEEEQAAVQAGTSCASRTVR